MKFSLKNKSILITGGTGSLGQELAQELLQANHAVEKLVVYSRDELKQFEMAQKFSSTDYPALRYFIGDIRDKGRFKRACEGVDVIIHAAALKQVTTAEYNPFECIKTNIIGAQNVIEAALECDVKRVVALSTDKAAAPINLYGATKLCSDKLMVAANNMRGKRDIAFSVVRYGNVMGSRGSVIPFFIKKRQSGVLPITDVNMTRFNITLEKGAQLVLSAIENSWGGEIYVPKLPSYKITDLATAIGPECKQEIVGIRPGEKIHEEMITPADSHNTLDIGDKYVILPQVKIFNDWNAKDYLKAFKGRKVELGFHYSSGDNEDWLTVEDIRSLIKKNVNPEMEL